MISVRLQCTTAKANRKIIQRSEFTSHIAANAKRVAANEILYKQRQALVEHPFSTIKRQWGFDHIITKKGLQAAHADAGLIALAYNLKRLLCLGVGTFKPLAVSFFSGFLPKSLPFRKIYLIFKKAANFNLQFYPAGVSIEKLGIQRI